MDRYDTLYRLYDEFDTETLRAYQEFISLFPPVDSRVALDRWQDAHDELTERKDAIRERLPDADGLVEVAAIATREQAFTALDYHSKYGRGIDVLVLDVDETLRSAGRTDNEIPREVLYRLTEFHDAGVPIVVCTGQTLENVKGFMIQGLGNELVHSGRFSIVYEGGTGVFTPGHGPRTKQLLYERLDDEVASVFDEVRTRVLTDAPEGVRHGCHLQGNEFNVTLKPNHETGSQPAVEVIDDALAHLLSLLGEAVVDGDDGPALARSHYADADPEIRAALARTGALDDDPPTAPAAVGDALDAVDVGYYEGDAVEITSRELNKVAGTRAAFDVLGVDDPFALVMGDSKSDLRVMEWVAERNAGIAAAPEHASERVLDHVRATDGVVFDRGAAADVLRMAAALDRFAAAQSE